MNEKLREAILKYQLLNWNLLPVKGKQPWDYQNNYLLRWDEYKTKRTPIRLLDDAEGVAVLTGEISGNLIAIDLDPYEKKGKTYNAPDGSVQQKYKLRSKKDLDLINEIWDEYRNVTMSQVTGRNGKRLFFTSDNSYVPKENVASGVAVMGNGGHYVVLAPSPHPDAHYSTEGLEQDTPRLYEDYNDVKPMHVNGWFFAEFCERFGLKVEPDVIDVLYYLENGVQEGDVITRNAVSMACAEWFFRKGFKEEDIIQKCLTQNKLNASPDKEADVKSAVKYQLKKHYFIKFKDDPKSTFSIDDIDLNFDYSRDTLKVAGGATDKFVYEGVAVVDKTGNKRWILIAWDGVKAHVIPLGVKDGKRVREVEILGQNYILRSYPAVIVDGIWSIKEALSWAKNPTFKDPKTVFNNIREVYSFFLDFTGMGEYIEAARTVGALKAIATYFFRAFSFYPLDLAKGESDTGKSVHAKATVFQSYHSTGLLSSLTPAVVFRLAASCEPTMIMDNIERYYDSQKMDEDSGVMCEIIDTGCDVSGKVMRMGERDENGDMRMEEFPTFCPKSATSVMGYIKSMGNRAIPITMQRTIDPAFSGRSQLLLINPINEDDEWATRIKQNRNDMYALRLKLFNEIKKAARINDADEIKKTGLTSRGYDVWKPILTVAKFFCPTRMNELVEYAKFIETTKEDDYNDEKNQALINTLVDLVVKEGWVKLNDIALGYNNIRGVGTDPSIKRASNSMVKRYLANLGFIRTKRGAGNMTVVYIDFVSLRRYAHQIHRHVGEQTVEEKIEANRSYTMQFRKLDYAAMKKTFEDTLK